MGAAGQPGLRAAARRLQQRIQRQFRAAGGQRQRVPGGEQRGLPIVIKNFMFQPMSVTVAPGAVVTVRNEDTVTHTLTDESDPKLFSTGDIAAGQSKTFKAPNAAGSYGFICSIHQYMTGTIVVR